MNLSLLSTQKEKLQYGSISDLKRPGNGMLDENTAVYLSNSAATGGGTRNLRNNLGRHHLTVLSKSQMKTRPPTTSTTPQFLC